MRTWGRVYDPLTHEPTWVEVTTDAAGFDDYVWLTTLIQCFKLNLGESPFFANYGIPAKESVVQQVFPNFYATRAQSQFAKYFASLIITQVPAPDPKYRVNVVTQQGVKVAASIPV